MTPCNLKSRLSDESQPSLVAARYVGMRQSERADFMGNSSRSLQPRLYLYYGEFWTEV